MVLVCLVISSIGPYNTTLEEFLSSRYHLTEYSVSDGIENFWIFIIRNPLVCMFHFVLMICGVRLKSSYNSKKIEFVVKGVLILSLLRTLVQIGQLASIEGVGKLGMLEIFSRFILPHGVIELYAFSLMIVHIWCYIHENSLDFLRSKNFKTLCYTMGIMLMTAAFIEAFITPWIWAGIYA